MYIKRKLGGITMNNIICISGRFNFEERRSKEVLSVIVRTILEAEVPSIREMARKAISKMFVNPSLILINGIILKLNSV